MARDGWTVGLAAAMLGIGAVALLYWGDMVTIDPWYMVLFVGGTAGISFLVGYVLGYLTETGIEPSSEDRE
jgi:hypothetical protein